MVLCFILYSPWNLLRHVRKNNSTTSLKRSAASFIQEKENKHFTTYGPFAENAINNSSEGSVLHLSENGQDVLVMEMVGGRFQVVAGTCEKLFIKLADETTQDFSYVDAYVLNHADFTTSEEFLENLMARFHIEPQPGETDYFRKWQKCIQIKVLNIISRWIKLQYQDFMNNPILLIRLQAFINGDITRGGFMTEANNIRELLHHQVLQYGKKRFSILRTELHRHRRPSSTTSPSSSSTIDPLTESSPASPLLSLDTKAVAQYLTLADFYLLKCITANEFLHGTWRKNKIKARNQPHKEDGYIHLMTKRANMLGGWTKNEIRIQQTTKTRAAVLKKMVDIVNLCLEWNNFHTSMIIVASLLDPSIQKLDEWAGLSNRDLHGYQNLVKLLDVSNNMGNYRQALGKAKSPTVPFFPLLLKDMTFFMDGNPTYLSSATTTTALDLTLINFAKYRSMTRCVHGILRATSDDYYFATDLGTWPFLPQQQDTTDYSLPLDRTAILLEQRILSV
ncbi:ras guanine nucleotide exchange factor domain-containing protein [Chlamydoabsidia padenii]|nr:ras guanine nucleotide exchange factor domain-containing protein [Chlamydoabsidia padenii]